MTPETIRHMMRSMAEQIQTELGKTDTNWDLVDALTNSQTALMRVLEQLPDETIQQKPLTLVRVFFEANGVQFARTYWISGTITTVKALNAVQNEFPEETVSIHELELV